MLSILSSTSIYQNIPLKEALCSFGEEIQTWNINI